MNWVYIVARDSRHIAVLKSIISRKYPYAIILDYLSLEDLFKSLQDDFKKDVPKDFDKCMIIADARLPYYTGSSSLSLAGYLIPLYLYDHKFNWIVTLIGNDTLYDLQRVLCGECVQYIALKDESLYEKTVENFLLGY